jgi:hypothetical protein
MSTAKLVAIAIAFLSACAQVDIFVTAASDEGTVYECRIPDGRVLELCYFDDAIDELSVLTKGVCDETSRTWPQITNFLSLGCAYSCPGRPRGCNAHNGCYCPK